MGLPGMLSKIDPIGERVRFGEDVRDREFPDGMERGFGRGMNILITAGNTQTPLDRVRCITNIFSGRTGAQIAARAFERGHSVLLLTSHPEALGSFCPPAANENRWRVQTYRTFDELDAAMGEALSNNPFDVVIHAAAVSDYRSAGIFTVAPGTSFNAGDLGWDSESQRPFLLDAMAAKVKSTHQELWLRLLPTPKLVDKIRPVWGFQGILVKFKLEVGLSESELRDVAERARIHSQADLMTANTLEGMHDWALIGTGELGYEKVNRDELADRLLDRVEVMATITGI